VRGNLVAIMRGPRAPAPPINYSQKLYFAQQAPLHPFPPPVIPHRAPCRKASLRGFSPRYRRA